MPDQLLDRLDQWKSRFGPAPAGQLERLLAAIAGRRFRVPGELIRLHETLLFLRAYPLSPQVARLADQMLSSFAGRIAGLPAGGDLSPFEEPEVSGIAGTSLSAVFSYEVARRLAARHPRSVEIAWDRYQEADKLGPTIRRFLPLVDEDWPVEAHVPFREWIAAARPRGRSDLAWLLARLAALPLGPRERAELYERMEVPLTWRMGGHRASRSRLRLPARSLFCHSEPLLRRGDVSLERELESPPLAVRRVPRRDARKILDLILDASTARYRELYGFSHPDEAGVYHADAGRGVAIFFFGVPPAWRLPLRAYHAGMFFKNGVPAGYVELLSLFERAEVGFNLYYTFREGESAWLFARTLRLFRQVLGVTCFSVDPYQIGLENPEAVDSGAFWFYRKLGFRPVDPQIAALVEREERRMRQAPGYRSTRRTLERLAQGYILFEGPGAAPGAWDNFRVRNLGLAVGRVMARQFAGDPERLRSAARSQAARTLGIDSSSGLALVLGLVPDLAHWSREEQLAAAQVLQAKERGDEGRYLRLMQRHAHLRAAFLEMGSHGPALLR
ncbi:MAG: hypothetical protein LAP87_29155 [Acidobacteriia bacterium]|nr:hypothetical protein [Terriglobia bacterium]